MEIIRVSQANTKSKRRRPQNVTRVKFNTTICLPPTTEMSKIKTWRLKTTTNITQVRPKRTIECFLRQKFKIKTVKSTPDKQCWRLHSIQFTRWVSKEDTRLFQIITIICRPSFNQTLVNRLLNKLMTTWMKRIEVLSSKTENKLTFKMVNTNHLTLCHIMKLSRFLHLVRSAKANLNTKQQRRTKQDTIIT